MRQVIVKLNEGVSGAGNALVDLAGSHLPGAGAARRDRERVRGDAAGVADVPFDALRWRSSHRTAASSRSASSARTC